MAADGAGGPGDDASWAAAALGGSAEGVAGISGGLEWGGGCGGFGGAWPRAGVRAAGGIGVGADRHRDSAAGGTGWVGGVGGGGA